MLRIALLGALGLLGVCIFYGIRTHRFLAVSAGLVERAVPYVQPGTEGGMRILVAGDSIGVGVGVSEPRFSMAGRLGAQYPDARIENVSVSGAKLGDIAERLSRAEGNFDLVYLHGGAKDVVGRTPYTQVRADVRALYAQAKEKSPRVIHLASGSVGFAPFFPQPLDWYFTRRTQKAYAIIKDEAEQAGVTYVDLYQPRAHDEFVADPARYFAADQFHPSDEGYALWFGRLSAALE